MLLSCGAELGPYEIVVPIGAGGMGEVSGGRHPRLARSVAIKVSKTEFSERFEREDEAIAALSYPHICQIYDVGPNYLVMEYVEGHQLKGPLLVGLVLYEMLTGKRAFDGSTPDSVIAAIPEQPALSIYNV